jgi:hypothetical protein
MERGFESRKISLTIFVAAIQWKIEELPRSTPLPGVQEKPLSRIENPVIAGFFCALNRFMVASYESSLFSHA